MQSKHANSRGLGSSIAVLGLLSILLPLALTGISEQIEPFSTLVFAAGTPDAYGNRIASLAFFQNYTGSWIEVNSLDYADYTSGYTMNIPSGKHTIIFMLVWLNDTLADNATQAEEYSRVFLTIEEEPTILMVQSGPTSDLAGFYWVQLWYPNDYTTPTETWVPAADTTYNMVFEYQAFFIS